MKTLYRLYIYVILMTFACACTDEDGTNRHENHTEGVSLCITMEQLKTNKLISRAAVTEEDNKQLSIIDNLYIRIETESGNTLYNSTIINEETGIGKQVFTDDGTVVTNGLSKEASTSGAQEQAYIHFDNLKAEDIKRVEIIGNYNFTLPLTDIQWEDAKSAVLQWPTTIDNFPNDQYRCPVYGYTDQTTSKEEGDHTSCDLFTVELKRPYAMVKVKVQSENLESGVSIAPTKVQLFNVPKTCTLEKPNRITNISTERQREGMSSKFEEDKNSLSYYSSRLYMFENMANNRAENNTSEEKKADPEWKKNPNETGDAYAAFEKNLEDEGNKGNYCSFIKVTADYKYTDNTGKSKSGTINYRLFLGEDIAYNFDVERNHIYDITLMLTGDGGLAEAGGKINDTIEEPNPNGYKWRVDITFLSDVYMEPTKIDLNAGTEMATVYLVEIDNAITQNHPDKVFFYGVFDTTDPNGPQPHIKRGRNYADLPKTYRFIDGKRPVYWDENGKKWEEIGTGSDVFRSVDDLPKSKDEEIDGKTYMKHPFTFIFAPFEQWELDEDEVEHPYREYTIILAMGTKADFTLRDCYLKENADEEGNEPEKYDHKFFIDNWLSAQQGVILSKTVIRQWNPIKVYSNQDDVSDHTKVAFYLDRKDRDAMPFGPDGIIKHESDPGEDGTGRNGFSISVGLYSANPTEAEKQMGENFMNPQGTPNYVSAYAYGLYTGAVSTGQILYESTSSIGGLGEDKSQMILHMIGEWKCRNWVIDNGSLWPKGQPSPKIISGSQYAFRAWSLPSDDEWEYLTEGYYNPKLEKEVKEDIQGKNHSYWSANYDDGTSAHVYKEGEIGSTNRSSKIPVRLRNSLNAHNTKDLGPYSLSSGLYSTRDLYILP